MAKYMKNPPQEGDQKSMVMFITNKGGGTPEIPVRRIERNRAVNFLSQS
jgi:hypothetical protein